MRVNEDSQSEFLDLKKKSLFMDQKYLKSKPGLVQYIR